MTKKKPPSGPEIPPGRASFPHRLQGVGSKASTEINLTKTDRKRLGEKCASGMAPAEALGELLAEKHAAKLARTNTSKISGDSPATRSKHKILSTSTAGLGYVNCAKGPPTAPSTAYLRPWRMTYYRLLIRKQSGQAMNWSSAPEGPVKLANFFSATTPDG